MLPHDASLANGRFFEQKIAKGTKERPSTGESARRDAAATKCYSGKSSPFIFPHRWLKIPRLGLSGSQNHIAGSAAKARFAIVFFTTTTLATTIPEYFNRDRRG
jgi:hypothetical protein